MKNCTQLKNFSASFCSQLTDESFKTLHKNNFRINSLSLGGCGNFTGCINAFFLVIKKDLTLKRFSEFCPKLKDLILPWNKQLTDKSLEYLANGCLNLKI